MGFGVPKRVANEELFEDGDKTLRFVANNGFGKAINSIGRDISFIFGDLAEGKLPIDDIENIMVCGIVDIDGDVVKESDKRPIVERLINEYGLQQCHQLAWILLSHLMIGKKKAMQIKISERREIIAQSLLPGRLTSSKKLGLLWAAIWISSAGLACLVSKLCALHIV